MNTRFKTVSVDGLDVFYREAGDPSRPSILLLHGFPTASHMFRDLIPELADQLSCRGARSARLRHDRDQAARPVRLYVRQSSPLSSTASPKSSGLTKFAIYIFDYGAPVGLRIAAKHPERISAIITQNGNSYLEGVSDAFNPVQAYWANPTDENRNALRGFLAPETTLFQYTHGVADASLVSPDGRNARRRLSRSSRQ